jgi:hypothetical protein
MFTNQSSSYSGNHIIEELRDTKFISVMTASSNLKQIKFILIRVCYSVQQQGIKIEILDFTDFPVSIQYVTSE